MEAQNPTTSMPYPRFSTTNIRRHIEARAHHKERSDDSKDTDLFSLSLPSTAIYEQEPFEFFNVRVTQLCSAGFPNATFHIERLRGGACNRITAITFRPLPPKILSISWIRSFLINHEEYVAAQEPKNYILRSRRKKPSSEKSGTEYDVPTLKFARIMLGDMVPDILCFDDSPCDAILLPYILQTHLHGQNLFRIWNSLTFSQKKSAMYIVVGLMKQLQTIQYPKAGLIAAANRLVHAPGRIALELHTFTTSRGPAPVLARAANSPAVSMTTRQFLLDQSRRWRLLQRYGVHSNETIWNCFDIITQFLYDMNFIADDDKFYFCHPDLYARNLLVELEHDSSLSLTGLLDWDAQFAHFCPKFVAYCAPFWLLVSSGNEYNEMIVADKPKDADYRRLKSLWEEAASDEWRQYAYKSEYTIARRMFALLRDSIHHDGDKEEARSIIDEWQKLYYEQRPAAAYANDEIHTNDGDPAAG